MNHAAALPENMEIDPLSSYAYPSFDNYPTQPYPYLNNKLPEPVYQSYQQNDMNNGHNPMPEPCQNLVPTLQPAVPETNVNNEVGQPKRKKKEPRQRPSNKKITDTKFPFYGCSVCNISYNALQELDQHVTVHKNRMTSYRLRLRNKIKRKQLKKEKKKLKEMLKVKAEIEIKPEDGYIGNEKAADFVNNENFNSECNGNQNNGVTKTECNENMKKENSVDTQNEQTTSVSNDTNNGNISNDNGNINNDNRNKSNDNGNDVNSKENYNETELNNLEKIYKCFACQKQFTLSYYLKLHVRSHTDEKPYTCSVCGESFITASKLGRHNKRIHLAERFQCRICFRVYSRFDLLRHHFDKKHPEDKLEGEPYDYNAILPYLKELEEQFKLREESDDKPKTEDLFWEAQVGPHEMTSEAPSALSTEIKEETQEDNKILITKLDIEQVEVDVDMKIKQEVMDDEPAPGADDEPPQDPGDEPAEPDRDDDGDEVKNEDSASDEDYFPSNTWAATPKPPPEPPSPRRRKKPSKICEICNKKVSSASYMRIHLRTHTGEKPFKCYTCGRGFITSSKMHRHVLTHEQEKEGIKSENDEKSDPEEQTAAEEETADSSEKPVKKKSKLKTKSSKTNAKEKTRKKNQKRPHACEFCNQKFLHLNMLEVHKKSHEGETLVHKCHYCLEEAIDEAALKEHEATHSGAKPYLCTICGKNYKKRESMVYHRKRHMPDKEFVCDICSKRFNASCKLQKHMVTHRGDKFVLRYECPVCAHMFNTKYHVHMHLKSHQKEGLILEENRNEILAMVLQNARKIPKQPNAPTNLTDIIPTDERSRVCNICGEVFHHFYYLEEHLKSHGSRIAIDDIEKDEEKKYICQICNKGFKLHYYLKLHSFTHSKEKPFICQQCGKGFITKGKLKRHLETHTGLKKYQCHICYKFFTRPSYLRIHIRTIHGTQDYNFRFDKGYGVGLTLNMSEVSQNSI